MPGSGKSATLQSLIADTAPQHCTQSDHSVIIHYTSIYYRHFLYSVIDQARLAAHTRGRGGGAYVFLL